MHTSCFKPGSLWKSVVERSKRAERAGTLEQIPTKLEVVEDTGIPFLVHLVDTLSRKRTARVMQGRTGTNPFLPYEPDMFVANISDTHVCLLNKFNVLKHHILIVTREFEHQESLLTSSDFAAMWTCLREFDGLAFYNSGVDAGASQPHKHFQQVPLPLGGVSEQLAIQPLVCQATQKGAIDSIEDFPWVHSIAGIPQIGSMPVEIAADETSRVYEEMLAFVGNTALRDPYNLLVTKDWIMMVLRSVESFATISVNALGFAGSLLVRNEEELEIVRRAGPMTILQQVGVSL